MAKKTVSPISAMEKNTLRGRQPTIALALGGGGARGLAHILILEALDEMGLRPKSIAGVSIGAIFGAAYASGLSGKEIRAHASEVLKKRFDLVRDLFAARVRAERRIWNPLSIGSALLAPNMLLDIILPTCIAQDFAQLDIPLKIVASDFYTQEPAIFSSGPLRHAIAASIALPVIFEPVVAKGRVLIDGGLVNPLPFDIIAGEADLTIAIDVSGAPLPRAGREKPKAWEALFASSFIFEHTIIKESCARGNPTFTSMPGPVATRSSTSSKLMKYWQRQYQPRSVSRRSSLASLRRRRSKLSKLTDRPNRPRMFVDLSARHASIY